MDRDPRGGHNRKKINEAFFKAWSPRMSYVLGFMFADGSLLNTNQSSRTFYLQFSNNDLNLLEKIKSALGSEHAIYSRPPRIMEHKAKKYMARKSYVLKMGNKIMYRDLMNLGLTHKKSKTMLLPLIPNIYLSFFLRGYFDGDGCINLYLANGRNVNRLSVIFTSGSTAFLNAIAIMLSRILEISPPYICKSMGSYNLISRGLNATKILDYMYSNLDLAPYLERKYLKYVDYKNNLMGPRVRKALTTT